MDSSVPFQIKAHALRITCYEVLGAYIYYFVKSPVARSIMAGAVAAPESNASTLNLSEAQITNRLKELRHHLDLHPLDSWLKNKDVDCLLFFYFELEKAIAQGKDIGILEHRFSRLERAKVMIVYRTNRYKINLN